jgi:hypothetical protein
MFLSTAAQAGPRPVKPLAGAHLNLLLRQRLLLLLQPHAVQLLLQLLLPVIIFKLVTSWAATIPVLLNITSAARLSRVAAPLAAM